MPRLRRFGRRVRVIVQARTTSYRLPGKALLPLAGVPSAVLCALRARNRGADVVVATSSDPSDDRLTAVLRDAGLAVMRGPLDDVLARFHKAASDLPAGSIVVRLTADNSFPDGRFVDALVRDMMDRNLDYLGANSPVDGLPYGMSAEAFTIEALRAAQRTAETAYDREHVTPWIVRHWGAPIFELPGPRPRLSHLRCTLDDLQDYLRLVKVFEKAGDAVRVPWEELCRILQRIAGVPSWRVPFRVRNGEVHGELALGTVQFGMNYGIVNLAGKPSDEEARAMIRRAVTHGVTSFDTARDYGSSEAVLGRVIKENFPGRCSIVTKLGSLSHLSANASPRSVQDAVDVSILTSCLQLGRKPLDAVLLHQWGHRTAFGGSLWKRLLELKRDGLIAKLGASVYHPSEGLEALADPDVSMIQIPFNILDYRWKGSGFIDGLKKRPDVLVNVRSVLLQGILAAPARLWPKIGLKDSGKWARKIASLSKRLGRAGALDLCVAYVRAQPWLTSLVMGMESVSQVDENLRCFLKPPLTAAECALCERELGGAPERLLNPSLWTAVKTRWGVRHG